jgi:dihydrofolate synthase / folylpolyglutamate synthase
LELLEAGGRDILLDGAHNPAGATALAAALDELRPFLADGRLTLITASMADKDVAGVVQALTAATSLRDALIVATQVDLRRALPAADLANVWRAIGRADRTILVEREPEVALERALGGPPGPIVVAGSLYLVGALRARLVDDPLLRDPVDNRR